jgi:hypothetical protein
VFLEDVREATTRRDHGFHERVGLQTRVELAKPCS